MRRRIPTACGGRSTTGAFVPTTWTCSAAGGDGAWRRSAEVHRQRAYSVEELTAWLAAAGFGDVRVYGDMRMRRPRADEQRVYISCVRK